MEVTTRVPQFHVQPVWLRTRQEEWSDRVVTVETRGYSYEVHRPPPEDATVKEVTLKKEKTGEWFAIFGIEMDAEPPAKPSLEEIDADEMVGIDVGILKYAHDTNGTAVKSLDLSAERDRLEREQRALSRKEYELNNWEKQRQRVADCHLRVKRKRRDFLHKLSAYYAREYELVAVEGRV